jgi:hypothetical protein
MMRRGITQIGAPLLCGALLLLGVVGLNRLLRGHFHDSQRSKIAFGDIDVEPPGTLSREEFLSEVQYLANWPDEINLLDEQLTARLWLVFAAHPWVEAVERVWIEPPRQVHVRLRYRIAVLTVAPNYVVDRGGVLLPQAAGDAQLPALAGTVAPPAGHTGQPWGNAGVLRAAAVAALLRPDQEQLQLKRFEIADGLLILSGKRARVVWGKVESDNGANEPSDEMKLQRLFELREKFATLDGRDVDLSRAR